MAAVDITGCTGGAILNNDINGASDETGATKAPNFQGIWVRADYRYATNQALYTDIAGNNIRFCANEGINVGSASQVTVSGGTIRVCYAGVAMYSNAGGDCTDNTVKGTVFSGITGLAAVWLGRSTGAPSGRTQRVTVSGISSTGSLGYGIGIGTDTTQLYPSSSTGTTTSATTTTLSAASSPGWTTNQWAGMMVSIVAGTRAGQNRLIYSNTSSVLTIQSGENGVAWATTPDSTSTYAIFDASHSGNTVQANTIAHNTLDAILVGGSRNTVSGNQIDTVTGGLGINAGGTTLTGNVITGNGIRGASSHGIHNSIGCVVSDNYADTCGGYLYLLDVTVGGGSRYRGNLCGPTNGTGTFGGGSEIETLSGGVAIGQGPGRGYVAFNMAYDGTNWRYTKTGYAYGWWLSTSDGKIHLQCAQSGTAGAIVSLQDAMIMDPGSNATFPGSIRMGGDMPAVFSSAASTLTVTGAENVILLDATSNNIAVTLLAASASFDGSYGLRFRFVRIDSVPTNTVTISRAGSDTINGLTSFTGLANQFDFAAIQAISTSAWAVMESSGRGTKYASYTTAQANTAVSVPATAQFCDFRVIGGGGGGGGGFSSGTSGGGGGGGGQGYTAWGKLSLSDVGNPANLFITVGAGGTAGTGSGVAGNAGSASLIGLTTGPAEVFVQANGGGAGQPGTGSAGGVGGSDNGLSFNYAGYGGGGATGGAGGFTAVGANAPNSSSQAGNNGGSGGGGGAGGTTAYSGGTGGGVDAAAERCKAAQRPAASETAATRITPVSHP